MARQSSPGYILHLRPYRNTSFIADVFSRDHGRVHLVARGVRSSRSKFYGVIQPFQELALTWQGNGEMYTLVNVEPCDTDATRVTRLSRAGDALASALYCNELVIRFFGREDPHPELYDIYKHTVQLLADARNIELTLRLFEKELVLQAGYALHLDHVAETGERVEAGQVYIYNADTGVMRPQQAASLVGIKISGNTLLAIANNRLDDEKVLTESKRLMRYVIACHLGDKPLNTRKFVMQKAL